MFTLNEVSIKAFPAFLIRRSAYFLNAEVGVSRSFGLGTSLLLPLLDRDAKDNQLVRFGCELLLLLRYGPVRGGLCVGNRFGLHRHGN